LPQNSKIKSHIIIIILECRIGNNSKTYKIPDIVSVKMLVWESQRLWSVLEEDECSKHLGLTLPRSATPVVDGVNTRYALLLICLAQRDICAKSSRGWAFMDCCSGFA